MTKTDAALQTLSDINPDVVFEVRFLQVLFPIRVPYILKICGLH